MLSNWTESFLHSGYFFNQSSRRWDSHVAEIVCLNWAMSHLMFISFFAIFERRKACVLVVIIIIV